MQIIATQSKAKPKIFAKSDYQALCPVDAKYATRPSPLSVEHSQIVALFWNLRFCAPPPIKSGQGPKSPSVVKVAPPLVVSAESGVYCAHELPDAGNLLAGMLSWSKGCVRIFGAGAAGVSIQIHSCCIFRAPLGFCRSFGPSLYL